MRKDFKQIGYVISLFFLGLLAWKPWIVLPKEGMDTQDYILRLLFILALLLVLPHALETVDYNRAAEKNEGKDEKEDEVQKP